MEDTLTGLLQNGSVNQSRCFNFKECTFQYRACDESVRPYLRYTAASAAWVLLCSIIVFFMKAGFMLVELAFARTVKERRHVVILKHQDAFASAFGFFLIGFDYISNYTSYQGIHAQFFGVTDPVLWFFKFTFASNAATIIGGCLVTNRYKLRLPAAFLSAFVISGIIHPILARLIWSDSCSSFSPYRFCENQGCGYYCTDGLSFFQRIYILDFAGGGAVHVLGGIAGLIICLFAKLQEYRDRSLTARTTDEAEEEEDMTPQTFLDWMYPVSGGEESVSDAALGVVILWFCWFAFNCGSTESVEVGIEETYPPKNITDPYYPFYGVPATIAVNMIMAAASGGILAVAIAAWAQIRCRSESLNANEIANGILSALVGITAGCAFVDYWAACLIGLLSVVFYHIGCYAEYKFNIKDTARVVPVHGVCGLWSLIAIGIFQAGGPAHCNLHAAFEGLCYCKLRLPPLNQGEILAAQIIGALIMIGISTFLCVLLYGFLYLLPMQPFVWLAEKALFLTPKGTPPLRYKGGWLFTSPMDEHSLLRDDLRHPLILTSSETDINSLHGAEIRSAKMATVLVQASAEKTRRSHYGTLESNQATCSSETARSTLELSASEKVPYSASAQRSSSYPASPLREDSEEDQQ